MVLSIWLLRGLRAAASDRINARVTHSLQERAVSYTHLRAHETVLDLVCRLLLEQKQTTTINMTTASSNYTTHNL